MASSALNARKYRNMIPQNNGQAKEACVSMSWLKAVRLMAREKINGPLLRFSANKISGMAAIKAMTRVSK